MLYFKVKYLCIFTILFLFMAAFPLTVAAKNYKINPQASFVYVVDSFDSTALSKQFSISGVFTYTVEENWSGGIGHIIRLKAFNIQPSILPEGPFIFR